MRSVGKKFGKQQKNAAKHGTENRRTHDVKPATLNAQPGTQGPLGPIFPFWYPVSGFELWGLG